MNNYLLRLGWKLVEIRGVLNWTQDELAKRIGVSRPVIVKIEKDASRMSKNIVLAMFVAIKGELQIRKRKILEFESSTEIKEIKKQMDDLGITNSSLRTIVPFMGGILWGTAIGYATNLIPILFPSLAQNNVDHYQKNYTESSKELESVLEEIIDRIDLKLKEVFELERFEPGELLNAIDNGEKSESM